MTGWGRGQCNPDGGRADRLASRPFFGRGGRGGGRRHRYWAQGAPRWRRGRFAEYEPAYYKPSYTREDELAVLQEEAAWLKEELNAIEQRLSEIETRQEG